MFRRRVHDSCAAAPSACDAARRQSKSEPREQYSAGQRGKACVWCGWCVCELSGKPAAHAGLAAERVELGVSKWAAGQCCAAGRVHQAVKTVRGHLWAHPSQWQVVSSRGPGKAPRWDAAGLPSGHTPAECRRAGITIEGGWHQGWLSAHRPHATCPRRAAACCLPAVHRSPAA